jgi:hypothetical protein
MEYIGFGILVAVPFWDMILYSLMDKYHNFGGTTFLQNGGIDIAHWPNIVYPSISLMSDYSSDREY